MGTEKDPASVDVVIVGSIGLDTIETPFESKEELLGGSASYACAAGSLFCRPGMVGVVGDDFPTAYLDLYRDLGIDLEGLQQVPGKTFRWSGVYDADMINRTTRSTELNVFESFTPELPARYRSAPYLLLGNIAPDLQLHVLSQIERPRFVVADTMDLWIRTARESLDDVIGKVDMLMLNDSEARLLTGRYNLRACAAALLEAGPSYVVIKKGEHGALLFSGDGIFIVPAYPVETVRDPTGAGDSFAGGFMGYLAGMTSGDGIADHLRKALRYGSVIASFGVEAFGLEAFRGLSRNRVDGRYDELESMIRA